MVGEILRERKRIDEFANCNYWVTLSECSDPDEFSYNRDVCCGRKYLKI